MKKILFFLLCASCLLLSNGCSSRSSRIDLSEEMKELGVAAVETTDDFLDGKITSDVAKERLENSYDSAKYLYDKELEEANTESLVGTDKALDSTVPQWIFSIKFSLSDKARGTGTKEDIIEDRNKLAELVGEQKR